MIGYFENGRVYIDVEVYGILPELKKTFKARLDTGFDGYLSIPLIDSFPLGLILKGTQSYTIADNSTKSNLVCWGTVNCNEKTAMALVDVASGPVLVGTKLLKEYHIEIQLDYANETVVFVESKPQKALESLPAKSKKAKK